MPQLLTRILSYLRRNVIAFVALFFALGAGGGYAIAATNNKTIHGCLNNADARALHPEALPPWAERAGVEPARPAIADRVGSRPGERLHGRRRTRNLGPARLRRYLQRDRDALPVHAGR